MTLSYLIIFYFVGLPRPEGEGMGIGLDSCVMPTRHSGIYLIQTTDLYPSIKTIMNAQMYINHSIYNHL